MEALFSEGLATYFEIEQIPNRTPKYSKYTNSFIKKWLPEVRKQNLFSKFSYEEWFLGRGKLEQLGFKIGTYLVHQIKKNHPELKTKDLTNKSPRVLLILIINI